MHGFVCMYLANGAFHCRKTKTKQAHILPQLCEPVDPSDTPILGTGQGMDPRTDVFSLKGGIILKHSDGETPYMFFYNDAITKDKVVICKSSQYNLVILPSTLFNLELYVMHVPTHQMWKFSVMLFCSSSHIFVNMDHFTSSDHPSILLESLAFTEPRHAENQGVAHLIWDRVRLIEFVRLRLVVLQWLLDNSF